MARIRKCIQYFTIILLFTSCKWQFLSKKIQPSSIYLEMPEVMDIASQLPNTAFIRKTEDGYVYLKVDDRFVSKIYPKLIAQLSEDDKRCLSKNPNSVGAHITLGTIDTSWYKELDKFSQYYEFKIKKLKKVDFKNISSSKRKDKKINRTWYQITVESPSALKLSQSMNPSMTSDIDLHISIAVAEKDPLTTECID